MAFEIFDKVQRKVIPKVSLRKNGSIGFSSGAVNTLKLQDYSYCKMYYDRETERIGFEFTNEEHPSVTFKVQKRQQDFFLFAKSFLHFYGIDLTRTRVFLGVKDPDTGYIVIDLKSPYYIRKSNKQ